MATLLSIPTTVTVLSPGSSMLSRAVASMAPGTWAQLNAVNQAAVLGVGGVTSSMLPYCNAMPWNPVNRRIEILAQDHNYGGMRHAQYDEATNTFVLVDNHISPTIGGHGYDHLEVNPYTGELFHKTYGDIGSRPLVSYRKPLGASTWSLLPNSMNFDVSIIYGTFWWKGPFTGGSGLGAQGGFGIYTRGGVANDGGGAATNGGIGIFDPLSNSWAFQATAMSPFINNASGSDEYNAVAAYSSVKNVAVYGGGHGNSKRSWRLNSNGTSTAMPDCPAEVDIGIHYGLFFEDPVTGNFLLLSKGHLYELNPDGAGRWTKQTGTRTPPATVGYPANAGPAINLVATALPDHGVIGVIRQSNSVNGAFWLYRHA